MSDRSTGTSSNAVSEGPQGSVSDTLSTATDAAKGATEQVQEQAGKVTDQARDYATNQLSSQKERAADTLGTVVDVLRQTSQQVREQDQGSVAQYIDKAADQAEQFARTVREQDLSQLLDSTEQWARRQPALFFGSTVAVGFLVTRFLKSSRPQQDSGTSSSPPPASSGSSASSASASSTDTDAYASDIFAPNYAGTAPGGTGYGATSATDVTASGSGFNAESGLDELPPRPNEDLMGPEAR